MYYLIRPTNKTCWLIIAALPKKQYTGPGYYPNNKPPQRVGNDYITSL